MTEEHHDTAGATIQPTPRGLFDCNDAYRTPIREDYEHLFTSGLVVLDTNVLLNLYRSNNRTRKDTLSVLGKLRDRIWIPHQVLSEFWRNRDLPSVRGHHRTKAKETCAALDKAHRSISDALDRWLRDVHLSNDTNARAHLNRDKESMENVLTSLKSFIQAQAERDALKDTSATQSDPVLTELDRVLHGRVGEPFPETTLVTALQEAKERADKRIPPGYEDFKDKPIEKAAGDYLLWAQILDEAERRKSDVLLVTGDVKPDWWIPATSHTPARPRTELTVELRKKAGVQLFMVTPSQLLTQANEIFNLRVDERSVNDLATAEREHTYPSYGQAIQSMLRQQFPQAQVLNLDDQFEKGVRPPIPDLTVIHSDSTIGIEVKKYTQPVRGEDIEYLKKMVEEHGLNAVLVVSHSPLTPAARERLRSVARETRAKAAWVRINSTRLDDLASYETLRMSVESLITPEAPEEV
ncbi:PIN-like domain-containing protein [Streptomyces rochei]|uniref:PIN-like domain-containing protein n=1 Tax=Streptomyces rochei TaxID=1928 RepID=UPI0036C70024